VFVCERANQKLPGGRTSLRRATRWETGNVHDEVFGPHGRAAQGKRTLLICAAFFKKYDTGGVLILYVKVLSAYAVITHCNGMPAM
jgi:hypothetical protein